MDEISAEPSLGGEQGAQWSWASPRYETKKKKI